MDIFGKVYGVLTRPKRQPNGGKSQEITNLRRKTMEKTMDKIVSLAKARGFVYPGSEIYGGRSLRIKDEGSGGKVSVGFRTSGNRYCGLSDLV